MVEGSLENVTLSDVFQIIVTGQKSGILTVIHQTSRARLYFDEGGLEYAHLTPGVHLGEILVRMEMLTTHEVQEILLRQAADGEPVPLGRLAVELAYLSDDELGEALERQAVEVVTEILMWQAGSFNFTERAEWSSPPTTGRAIDAMSLLMTVAQRLDEYRDGTVEPDAIFERSGDPTKVDMPQGGWEVLGYVDGKRTARSIGAELDLAERHVYHLLYTLREHGVISAVPFDLVEPMVLVISSSSVLQRLLRLALQRASLHAEVVDDAASGMTMLETARPSAVVIDDQAGEAWDFVRELRKMPAQGHLPVVVIGNEDPAQTLLGRFRRPKATFIQKPFHEIDFQQLITRLMGRSLA